MTNHSRIDNINTSFIHPNPFLRFFFFSPSQPSCRYHCRFSFHTLTTGEQNKTASYGSLARFKDIQRLYPLYSSSAPHPGQTSQSTAGAGVLSESAPNPANSGSTDKAEGESKEKEGKDEKEKEAKKARSSHTCLAVAGDMSDFQYLKKMLEGVV